MGLAAVIGVLVIGPLFDIVNSMLLLTVCLVMLAVSAALAPTWRIVYLLFTLWRQSLPASLPLCSQVRYMYMYIQVMSFIAVLILSCNF